MLLSEFLATPLDHLGYQTNPAFVGVVPQERAKVSLAFSLQQYQVTGTSMSQQQVRARSYLGGNSSTGTYMYTTWWCCRCISTTAAVCRCISNQELPGSTAAVYFDVLT